MAEPQDPMQDDQPLLVAEDVLLGRGVVFEPPRVEVDHLVPLIEEHVERALRQSARFAFVVPGARQRLEPHGESQRGPVVTAARLAREHDRAQLGPAFKLDPWGDVGRMLREPGAHRTLGATNDAVHVPQRVVEVERDHFERRLHSESSDLRLALGCAPS
jgi:hypothetical protein